MLTLRESGGRICGDCNCSSKLVVQGGYKLRKWVLLAVASALSLVVAVPAVAQTTTAAQCSTITRNGQAVTEYSGVVDGVEVSGSVVQPNSTISVDCKQLVLEAASAQAAQADSRPSAPAVAAEANSGNAEAKAGGAEAKAADTEAKAGKTEAKVEAKTETKAELPKTGGGDTLFALGVGALLVGGGLLLRKLAQ